MGIKIINSTIRRFYDIANYLLGYWHCIGKKCINLGCGQEVKLGYLNCDIDTRGDHRVNKIDLTNLTDLLWLSNQKADIVEATHIVGDFNEEQLSKILEATYSGLNSGGYLCMEFVDASKLRKITNRGDSSYDRITWKSDCSKLVPLVWNMTYEELQLLDGKYSKNPEKECSDFINYVLRYSTSEVMLMLEKIGYSKCYVLPPKYHGGNEKRDIRIVAWK